MYRGSSYLSILQFFKVTSSFINFWGEIICAYFRFNIICGNFGEFSHECFVKGGLDGGKGEAGSVTGSHDLTCPSQLGSESSANGVTEGGTEGEELV